MKKFFRSKLVLAAAVVGSFAFAFAAVQTVGAQTMLQDCSENSIIPCGATSPANFIAKLKENKRGDLKTIYNYFNLPASGYDQFAKEAKVGTAYKNGTIVVDGQVVARNAWSLGRDAKSYSDPLKIGSKTYHQSDATDVFNRDSMPVFVWFKHGQVTTAILQPCANPMGGEPVIPSYKCQQLKSEAVAGKENTYRFTTEAPVSNNATVSKVVYEFGDGTTVTKTKPSDAVVHTYTKAGTHTAKVTVYVKLPGGEEVKANSAACAKQITVKEKEQPKPPVKPIAAWQCTGLTATQPTQANNSFTYTLRANASMSNARLVSADFDFGDGSTMNGVTPANATDTFVSTNHTYASGKSYTVKATLHFQANANADAQGAATSVTCQVTINPPAVLASVTTPATPQTLPAAGAAGLAGLFGGASVLGTLGYRWHASRKLNRVNDLIERLQR